ncbi:acetylcholine receptor subunit alpha-like 1 isoform X2 [Mercenaria mercenaria]|uniref:acetylcholine receptor subunit alpha-like 1 isoform X2 n=1 Tax=Mercenaria mercenaria TaxID=6596 RepID=UPI00234F1BD0|nr:acetylcholine receptor subunit alpha-like 1 isoform X2 [Mercenaria mercenaria]
MLFHNCVGVLLIVLSQQSAGTGTVADRGRLYNDLLTSYQKELIPGGANGGPVVVFHFLNIQRVVALEHGILTLQVWEHLKWNDPRLRWDSEDYNISILHLPSRHIWQPDVVLSNSAEQYTGFASGDVHVHLTNDGNVTFIPPRITKSVCHFDDSDLYENNEVTCTLKYMPWSRDLNSLDLRIDVQPEIDHNTNPNWNLVETSATRHVLMYACCPDSSYVDVEYTLQLKRIK